MQRFPYKGQTVRRRYLSSFGLVETTFPPCADIKRHLHDYAYISFLLCGSYTERGIFQSYNCSAGSVIFHPAGEEHSDRFNRFGGRLLNLQLDPNWLARLAVSTCMDLRETTVLSPPCFRFGLELHAGFDSLPLERVDDLTIELISHVASVRQPRTPPKWFRDSLEIVETSVQNCQSLSLREIARRCEIHPVHLSRCYRKFVGINFSRYVIQRRIKKAFQILLETDMAIVDVAFDCGFADHAHFCRTFRSAIGFTPTEFRARLNRA